MEHLLGPLAALMSSFTWSLGSATYTNLARTYPAFIINFNRAAIAFPICILAVFASAGGLAPGLEEFARLTSENLFWLTVSMIASYAFADVLFFSSALILGVPSALAIASVYPLWSATAGYFLEGQALSMFQVMGLILVVASVIVVILAGRHSHRTQSAGSRVSNPKYFKGVLLALITSLLWFGNTYAVMKGGVGITSTVGNSCRMLFAMILCPIIGALMRQKGNLKMQTSDYKTFGWIFALEAFGGSTFFMYGLTHAPLAIASALSSLSPAISVPITWILKKETPSLYTTLGILGVVIGVVTLVSK